MKRRTFDYIRLGVIVTVPLVLAFAVWWTNPSIAASAWLDVMIRQYGVQLLFTGTRMIGLGLTLWLTVAVTNWRRDRDERRNIGEKERVIIERLKQERDRWKLSAEESQRIADDRLAIIRVVTAGIGRAAVQLRGAGADERRTK